MKKLKLSDIKPIGNFELILNRLREKADSIIDKCNEHQKYNSALSQFINKLCNELQITHVLEEGIKNENCWNIEELKICLLYTYLILIDINETSHKYLNPTIIFPSKIEQLQDYINTKSNVFGELIIIK